MEDTGGLGTRRKLLRGGSEFQLNPDAFLTS